MMEWWQLHPMIAPLPKGFRDDDCSHRKAKEWMDSATDHIADLKSQLEDSRKAVRELAPEVARRGAEIDRLRTSLAEARAQIAAKDAALALFDAYYALPDKTHAEFEKKQAAWLAWVTARDALSQPATAQDAQHNPDHGGTWSDGGKVFDVDPTTGKL